MVKGNRHKGRQEGRRGRACATYNTHTTWHTPRRKTKSRVSAACPMSHPIPIQKEYIWMNMSRGEGSLLRTIGPRAARKTICFHPHWFFLRGAMHRPRLNSVLSVHRLELYTSICILSLTYYAMCNRMRVHIITIAAEYIVWYKNNNPLLSDPKRGNSRLSSTSWSHAFNISLNGISFHFPFIYIHW